MSRIILLLLAISLVGCTSHHFMHIESFLGITKILGVFEVDVHSFEKQTFEVKKWDEPSFWAKTSNGEYRWDAALCYDNVDSLDTMFYHPEMALDMHVMMGDDDLYSFTSHYFHNDGACYVVNESEDAHQTGWRDPHPTGWHVSGVVINPDQKITMPMKVEFQIKEDKDSLLQKLYDKYGSPHLIVYTGEY